MALWKKEFSLKFGFCINVLWLLGLHWLLSIDRVTFTISTSFRTLKIFRFTRMQLTIFHNFFQLTIILLLLRFVMLLFLKCRCFNLIIINFRVILLFLLRKIILRFDDKIFIIIILNLSFRWKKLCWLGAYSYRDKFIFMTKEIAKILRILWLL